MKIDKSLNSVCEVLAIIARVGKFIKIKEMDLYFSSYNRITENISRVEKQTFIYSRYLNLRDIIENEGMGAKGGIANSRLWPGLRLHLYLGKLKVVLTRISEHLDRFLVRFRRFEICLD